MIDTHAHLLSEYYDDLDLIVNNAKEIGIKGIVVSGYDMKSNIEVLSLVKKYDILYGSIGFHPENLEDNVNNVKWLEQNINNDKIVAVGEIGLDYHYDGYNRDLQQEYFKNQLEIAVRNEKPVIVHSRDAINDTYNILNSYNGRVNGVIHCYSGSVEMAKKFVDLGMYLGIGGIITFNNAKSIIDVIKEIDLKYIVLETDSPYITPVPYRGKVNESKNLEYIALKIASILNISYNDVGRITTNNARGLFDFDFNM